MFNFKSILGVWGAAPADPLPMCPPFPQHPCLKNLSTPLHVVLNYACISTRCRWKGVAGVLVANTYIIMKVISFNDSSIQAYRLGKACIINLHKFCCRSTYVYKRLSAKNRSSIRLILHILLLLYNSHKECSVLYLMHAHTCVQK